MKERPILMNSAMVRATLDGSKTQTRRLVKPHGWTIEQMSKYEYVNVLNSADANILTCSQPADTAYAGFKLSPNALTPAYFKCPFGTVGDQLWVRETFNGPMWFGDDEPADSHTPKYCHYAATEDSAPEYMDADDNLVCRWKPSIHMPRWASRIQLEITGVRVERLNDISEEDAKAEGVTNFGNITDQLTGERDRDAVDSFIELWQSINGSGSWVANPWVWVIEFKRVKP